MKTQKQAQPETKQKKVLNIVVNVLLVAVIIFGVFCSYTAFATKTGNGVPNFFGIQAFSIQSPSMEPEFYEGDLIIDKSVKDTSKLEVGDVITFYTIIEGERALNTHRIIEIIEGEPTYYVTKGDNNTLEDAMRVHENEIVGQYLFDIPNLGGVIDFLQTSTGFLVVIVLPVFLFFIYNLVQFFRVFFDYRMKKMRMQIEQEMAQSATSSKNEEVPQNTAPTGDTDVPQSDEAADEAADEAKAQSEDVTQSTDEASEENAQAEDSDGTDKNEAE